jgi:hypothetical protein
VDATRHPSLAYSRVRSPQCLCAVCCEHTHTHTRWYLRGHRRPARRERSNRRVCSALDLCLLWLATRRRCKAPCLARRPILKLETVATEPMAVTFTPVPTAHYSFITARVHNIAPGIETLSANSQTLYFLSLHCDVNLLVWIHTQKFTDWLLKLLTPMPLFILCVKLYAGNIFTRTGRISYYSILQASLNVFLYWG